MPEDGERASADRHATWVALRTLRQRPTVVGHTDGGEAVYEVGSVRALLTGGASHFNRLVQCAKCGRDVAGPPLLSPADLDRPPNPIFCERCVRNAVPTSPQPKAEVARRVSSPPAQRREVDDPLAELRRELRGLIDTQRGEMEHALVDVVQRTLAAVAPPLQELKERQQAFEDKLSEDLAGVRAEMLALAAERQRVADGLEALRADVATLAQAVESRLDELTTSAEAADSRIHTLEQRVMTSLAPLVAEASAPRRTPGQLLESLEQQLREAEERIAGR